MTSDLAYFTLFERLSPLLASGHATIAIIMGHEIRARFVWPSNEPAHLALALANAIPSLREHAGLIVETPDHVRHFVRLV